MLPHIKTLSAEINTLDHLLSTNEVSLSILRLDKIHPEISGNKFFKLFYFLQKAILEKKPLVTFGGAYSNHLYATAAACSMAGISCTGIVRGERPVKLSHTLLFCLDKGMKLDFISREKFKSKYSGDFRKQLIELYGEHILVPEGGYSAEGAAGASLIADLIPAGHYTHICCAVGTATTVAGLARKAAPGQYITGFSALKDMYDFSERLIDLNGEGHGNYSVINAYHFGGYAKKNETLTRFMNWLYEASAIPTDFVYTGKMMFGIIDLVDKNYFPGGSRIICIHTGGLQGNRSLPNGILNF